MIFMKDRIYLEVTAVFDPEGGLKPSSFVWEDGEKYEISKVKDIRPEASLKAGGTGMRYTCRVGNNDTFLFLEDGRWFVERRCY
jgi:hypothetical protein